MKNLIIATGFILSTTTAFAQPTSLTIDNGNCYRVFAKAVVRNASCGGTITSATWIPIASGASVSIAALGVTTDHWDEVLIRIDPFNSMCLFVYNSNDGTQTGPNGNCLGYPTNVSGVTITCNKGCAIGTSLGTNWTAVDNVLVN